MEIPQNTVFVFNPTTVQDVEDLKRAVAELRTAIKTIEGNPAKRSAQADGLDTLPDEAFLSMQQIVTFKGGKKRTARVGYLPFSRSKWLKMIAEGKVPPGRKMDPGIETSPLVWPVAVVRKIAQSLQHNSEAAS